MNLGILLTSFVFIPLIFFAVSIVFMIVGYFRNSTVMMGAGLALFALSFLGV